MTTPDRYTQGNVQRRVDALRIGDRVDLEGDIFADPFASFQHVYSPHPVHRFPEHPEFAFEFELVENIEVETPDCVRVDFESGFSCGFPPEHWLDVDGEQVHSA